MEVKVRTMPAEGFGSIDLEADFTDHILTVLFGDTCRWRLEKAGRTAVCRWPEEIHVVGRQSVGSNRAGRE